MECVDTTLAGWFICTCNYWMQFSDTWWDDREWVKEEPLNFGTNPGFKNRVLLDMFTLCFSEYCMKCQVYVGGRSLWVA